MLAPISLFEFNIYLFNDALFWSMYRYNYVRTWQKRESRKKIRVILSFPSATVLSHFAVSFPVGRTRNFASQRNFEAMRYPLGQGYLISRILGGETDEALATLLARKTRKVKRSERSTEQLVTIDQLIFVVNKFIVSLRLARVRRNTAKEHSLFRIKEYSRSYSSNYSCLKNGGWRGRWFLSVVLHLNPKFYT